MQIRKGTIADAEPLAQVEVECFPPAEAASPGEIRNRLTVYPAHFLLVYEGPVLVGFIDGMASSRNDLTDDMYENASLHDEAGPWQMIFGLNTRPAYRRKGYAGALIRAFQKQAAAEGRKGIVLTCKEKLVHYYAEFGFADEGISSSTHGGVVWHQMRWLVRR